MTIRIKLLPCLTALFFVAHGVSAQSQKDICQALNEPINMASNSFGTLSASISSLDVTPLLPKLNSDLQKSFLEMEARRLELLPVLNAYLIALEDSALLVKRCAR